MSGECARDEIVLNVPAEDLSLMVVRLTASGVASSETVDVDTLDDFKAAVYEACYLMIHQPCGYERLRVAFFRKELAVHVAGEGERVDRGEEAPPDPEMCRIVLESLVASAKVETDGPHIASVSLFAKGR